MSDELLLEIKDRIAFITLNREAKRNALSPGMIEAFHQYLDDLDKNDDVRVICLTGTGEKAFCSGADLGGGLSGAPEDESSPPRRYAALLAKMAGFGKPIVAKVAGPCLAGGTGLMLASHIVVARSDVFFRLPEINVGIFPFMVGALLYRNLTWKKAVEISLTGRKVLPDEAERIGMITTAVDPGAFEAHVDDLLSGLASRSPVGMRLGLEAFRRLIDMPLEDGLQDLSLTLIKAAKTEDAKEGIMAFLEKRQPNFTGK